MENKHFNFQLFSTLGFIPTIFCILLQAHSGSSHVKVLKRAPTESTYHCPVEIKSCIEPITSKICSGQGACVCGQCACFQTDFEKYYGRFCEHCESCSPNLCEFLKPCVECRVHSSGQYKKVQDCDSECSRFPEIQIAEVASSDERDGNYFCAFKDNDDCEFYFVYGYDAVGHLVIIAEREKECPLKPLETSRDKEFTLQQQKQHSEKAVLNDKRPPPVFTELKSIENIPVGDSGINANFSRKVLNTQAFDLMIVCGLAMTRHSDRTTQIPQYLQRNGIHFDLQNCQFIPKADAFPLIPRKNVQQFSRTSQAMTSIPVVFSLLLLFFIIK